MGCTTSTPVTASNTAPLTKPSEVKPGNASNAKSAGAPGSNEDPAVAAPTEPSVDANDSKKFDELEKEINQVVKSSDKLWALWDQLDRNGNDKVSLSEIHSFVSANYPLLNKKPALMSCYKKTIASAASGGDGNGDAWVERHEFKAMLVNLLYFNKAWDVFSQIDGDSDRRVSAAEFKSGLPKFGVKLKDKEADAEFAKMDTNNSGLVLFDEFCVWISHKKNPVATAKTQTRGSESGADEATTPPAVAENAAPAAIEPAAAARQAQDNTPDLHSAKYDALEGEVIGIAKDAAKLGALWGSLDGNGNGKVSLSEIDAFVQKKYPLLNSKPALMRAYKRTLSREAGGDGDDFVEKPEFKALLVNLFFYNRAWDAFDGVDKDDDRKVSFDEFKLGLAKLGLALDDDAAKAEFLLIDTNGGGAVLFEEFCAWLVKKKAAVD